MYCTVSDFPPPVSVYVPAAYLPIPRLYSRRRSDWTDTELRKDQTKYLCSLPSAKGTNPTTGADTRESLRCQD